jgi:hypothetical protein
VSHNELERRIAIVKLLDQPDPPDLQRRTHRLRFSGKPERFSLVAALSAVYVQHKLLALELRRNGSSERLDIHWGDRRPRQLQSAA